MQSSTRSDIARAQLDLNLILAQNPDLAVAGYGLLKGEDLSDRDRLAASQCLSGFFRAFENQFWAYREGNFSESVWLGYRANIIWNAQQSHFKEFWGDRRGLFSEEFVAFVDDLASKNSPNVSR